MCNVENADDFYGRIKQELDNCIAVGLTVMTEQVAHAIEVSRYIRKLNPSIPIIWGGVHPTLYTEQTVRADYVDFAVVGEGEITAYELLQTIENGQNYTDVKGIAFQDSNKEVIMTGGREFIDVNELPSLDWGLLEGIKPGISVKEASELTGRGLFTQTSRGCPHQCTFCIDPVLKIRYRYREAELVLKDIEELLELGIDRIYFIDDNFFTNKNRLLKILDGVEERGLKFKWFGNVRADYFTPNYLTLEVLSRVKRCGCERVSIGAESGSQKILDKLKKNITPEQILRAAELLDKTGIKCDFSFMMGLPGEEIGDIRSTLQIVEKIRKMDSYSNFGIIGPQIYRPYPGSKLYFECLEAGMKEPNTLEEWIDNPYLKGEFDLKNSEQELFPWVNYPLEELSKLAFYAWLSGIKLRFPLINKLLRIIGAFRCRKLYFRFPVLMRVYKFFTRNRSLVKFMARKKDM
jgi:radical SAM superfamily enzyme YgiQ (UPF0313 family)